MQINRYTNELNGKCKAKKKVLTIFRINKEHMYKHAWRCIIFVLNNSHVLCILFPVLVTLTT